MAWGLGSPDLGHRSKSSPGNHTARADSEVPMQNVSPSIRCDQKTGRAGNSSIFHLQSWALNDLHLGLCALPTSPQSPGAESLSYSSIPLTAAATAKSLSCVLLFATPWTYSLPGSSVHRILRARILEWVAICFSRGSSRLKGWTHVSCVSCSAGRFCPTEPSEKPSPWHGTLNLRC